METTTTDSGPGGPALTVDFDLMGQVADQIDSRNEDIRAMLANFIGQMSAIPAAVWGGDAATRFAGVVERWNAESLKLHAALERIAQTIRLNAVALDAAGRDHAARLASVLQNL